MAFDWNVFRIMADVSHTASKCILIWAIHSNKSAEGMLAGILAGTPQTSPVPSPLPQPSIAPSTSSSTPLTHPPPAGVSLITQLLYLLVFCSRYLFLPLWSAYDRSEFHKLWNLTLKLFYIASSAYIVFLMMRVYARTREREKAWKLGIGSFVGSAVLAPVVMLLGKGRAVWGFPEVCRVM